MTDVDVPPGLERYAAFATDPGGGNPAGVLLDARHLTDAAMQRIAAQVGYSECAFITSPLTRGAPLTVRYFAPDGEVDFCGHATIATAVALGHRLGSGDFELDTRAGRIAVSARREGDSHVGAFLSRQVSSTPLRRDLLDELLGRLGWVEADLDLAYPPAIAFGGNNHPVLVAGSRARLADLHYDFAGLRDLCRREGWITVQLVVPTGPTAWRSRNPFPWGGVVEDPATGSAAAALAGYLEALGRLEVGGRFTVTQGVEMGRESIIGVQLERQGAAVSGPAVPITGH
jgi:PhzF family phenazine biosynthesis protein